jgi:hypothetical protein
MRVLPFALLGSVACAPPLPPLPDGDDEPACTADDDCLRNHACVEGTCTFVLPECQPVEFSSHYRIDPPVPVCRQPCGGMSQGAPTTLTYENGKLLEWTDGRVRSVFSYDDRSQRTALDFYSYVTDAAPSDSFTFTYAEDGLLAHSERISDSVLCAGTDASGLPRCVDIASTDFVRDAEGAIQRELSYDADSALVRRSEWIYEDGKLARIETFDGDDVLVLREIYTRDIGGRIQLVQSDTPPFDTPTVVEIQYDINNNVIYQATTVSDVFFVDTFTYGDCDR